MFFEKILKTNDESEITVENYFRGRQHGSNKWLHKSKFGDMQYFCDK